MRTNLSKVLDTVSIMQASSPPPPFRIVIDEDSESVFGSEYDAYNNDNEEWYTNRATRINGDKELLAIVEKYKTIYKKPAIEEHSFKELTWSTLLGAINAASKEK